MGGTRRDWQPRANGAYDAHGVNNNGYASTRTLGGSSQPNVMSNGQPNGRSYNANGTFRAPSDVMSQPNGSSKIHGVAHGATLEDASEPNSKSKGKNKGRSRGKGNQKTSKEKVGQGQGQGTQRQHHSGVNEKPPIEVAVAPVAVTPVAVTPVAAKPTTTPSGDKFKHLTNTALASMPLSAATQKALATVMGLTFATNVQEACIPVALDGLDVVGQAKTGTGVACTLLGQEKQTDNSMFVVCLSLVYIDSPNMHNKWC